MAPSAITEDYYKILEVDPTAEPELIVKSYRRLALKVHPDRNSERDATEAFQRLGRAYETLKDESERHKYDLIYPFLKGKVASSQQTREPKTTEPVSTASENAQIAALRKSKQERATRWSGSKMVFDASISEAERAIRRLEQELKGIEKLHKQGDNNKRRSFWRDSDKKKKKLEGGEGSSKNPESSKKSFGDLICVPHSPVRRKVKHVSMAR
ncbi:hypothetical protein N0V87_009869 [Didymella glomerata]|uniref:J domain-containing protein n=1 Tax=Didymella glomerata TaxID=749621 RepID=A0A9W9BWJ5_9PLEO|nr:hypothetical protein N0V87_009869 [Didymella glomerata]